MNNLSSLPPPPKNKKGFTLQELQTPSKNKSGFIDRTKSAFNQGIGKIKTAVSESQLGRNPISTGAKAGAGAIEAAFSPLTAAVQPAIEPTIGRAMGAVSNKISGIPAVQKFAQSKAGKTTERIAEDVGNIATIAGTSASLAGASKVAKSTSNMAKTISDKASAASKESVMKAKAKVESGLKQVLKPKGKDIASTLRRENLRLTPAQVQKLGDRIDDVVDYAKKRNLQGTPEQQYNIVKNDLTKFEGKIQKTLENSGRNYTKSELSEMVNDLPRKYADAFDNPEIHNQLIRKAEALTEYINKNLPDNIPASKVNALKRAYAKNAWNKGGDAIANQASEAISDGLYTKLLQDVPKLKVLNKDYQKIILTGKVLGKAIGRNELGFLGNLTAKGVGTIVGGAVGGPVGGAIGFMAGSNIAKKIAGTAARSKAAGYLEKVKPK